MTSAGWGAAPSAAVLLAVLGVTAWQAVLMARRGPTTRLTVPAAMSPESTVDERAAVPGGSNR
jgi:hypothetical protein